MAKISAYPCAYNNLEKNKFLNYFSVSSKTPKEDIPLTPKPTDQDIIKKEHYDKQKFLNFFSMSCKSPKGDIPLILKYADQDSIKKDDYKKEKVINFFEGFIPLIPKAAEQNAIKKEVYNKDKFLEFFSVSLKSSREDIAFPRLLETDEVNTKSEIYVTSLPIEECPMCYKVLVPLQFTVNIVTAVFNTICHCGLSIQIDPKLTFSKTMAAAVSHDQSININPKQTFSKKLEDAVSHGEFIDIDPKTIYSKSKAVTVCRKRKRSESHITLKRLRLCNSCTDF